MTASLFRRRSLLALFLSLALGAAYGQDKPAAVQYEPEVGQHGKDVVWGADLAVAGGQDA